MSDFDQSATGQGPCEDFENDTMIKEMRQKQRDSNLDLQIQKCITNNTKQPTRSKTPKKRACISSNSLLFDDELLKNNLDVSFASVSEESGRSSVRQIAAMEKDVKNGEVMQMPKLKIQPKTEYETILQSPSIHDIPKVQQEPKSALLP